MLESFPWDCLESDHADGEALIRWIYAHFAGRAYQGFLELGRGLLVGPFLTDEDKNHIASDEAMRRHREGIGMALTVTYVALDHPMFEGTLPDPALRAALRGAIERYVPDQECIILTLTNNTPHLARIVGSLKGASHLSSPKMSYEVLRRESPGQARLIN